MKKETEILTTEYIDRLIEIAKLVGTKQKNKGSELWFLLGYINALENLSMRRVMRKAQNEMFETMRKSNYNGEIGTQG